MDDMFEGFGRPHDVCRARRDAQSSRQSYGIMITRRLTESKPDFRSEGSWGETRAYERQPSLACRTRQFPLTCRYKAFATRRQSCTWTADD